MEEQVLVFPAESLLGFPGDAKGGVLTDVMKVHDYLQRTIYSCKTFYMNRAAAEQDRSFKQVIPYVVFLRGQGPSQEVYTYQRTQKSGEARLRAKWSVGIGGHINPIDGEPHDDNGRRAYWKGFERELAEEVYFPTKASRKTYAPISALIYDDSDDVGAVHFGVVHLFQVPDGTVLASEDPAIHGGHWVYVDDMKNGEFASLGNVLENWSNMVVEHVL